MIDINKMSIREENSTLSLKIERPVLNNVKLHEKFKYVEPVNKTLLEKGKAAVKRHFTPSKTCLLEGLLKKLPIIDLFLTYKLKYVVKDFLSGLTVGIIQIAPSTFSLN